MLNGILIDQALAVDLPLRTLAVLTSHSHPGTPGLTASSVKGHRVRPPCKASTGVFVTLGGRRASPIMARRFQLWAGDMADLDDLLRSRSAVSIRACEDDGHNQQSRSRPDSG